MLRWRIGHCGRRNLSAVGSLTDSRWLGSSPRWKPGVAEPRRRQFPRERIHGSAALGGDEEQQLIHRLPAPCIRHLSAEHRARPFRSAPPPPSGAGAGPRGSRRAGGPLSDLCVLCGGEKPGGGFNRRELRECTEPKRQAESRSDRTAPAGPWGSALRSLRWKRSRGEGSTAKNGNGSGASMHSGMRGGPHVGALRRCSFTNTESYSERSFRASPESPPAGSLPTGPYGEPVSVRSASAARVSRDAP